MSYQEIEDLRRYVHLIQQKESCETDVESCAARLVQVKQEIAAITAEEIAACAAFLTAEVDEARGGDHASS